MAMWIDSVVQIGQESIGVRVKRLDVDSRAKAAISIAWLATGHQGGQLDLDALIWDESVEEMLRQHVSLTVTEDRLVDGDSQWWSEVVSRALVQLVRANELVPDI